MVNMNYQGAFTTEETTSFLPDNCYFSTYLLHKAIAQLTDNQRNRAATVLLLPLP